VVGGGLAALQRRRLTSSSGGSRGEVRHGVGASERRRRALYGAAVALVIAAVAFAHLFRLPAVPRGLYFDECSIGLNAASIAAGGRDEHGVLLPVFFASFSNLKNPLYIYATALLFRLAAAAPLLCPTRLLPADPRRADPAAHRPARRGARHLRHLFHRGAEHP
jgi:hypothetical protein